MAPGSRAMRRVLGTLLEGIAHSLSPELLGQTVSSVSADSRELARGAVFVAVRGTARDGHDFIPMAARAGVLLIVGEKPAPPGLTVPYLRVSDSRRALARMASAFHAHPSWQMKVVGVTGTSGKTTTTYLIESILQCAGETVGLIGTVNFRYPGKSIPSTHTTPGPLELQKLFAEMRSAGCTAVVMEVSSHGLAQGRSASIAYDAMVFTNLSPEHLDFHKDMEDYFASKRLLFTEGLDDSRAGGKEPVPVINRDDPYGRRLLGEIAGRAGAPKQVLSYGCEPEAEISGADLAFDLLGMRGRVAGIELESSLTGRFNAQNVLAAVGVGKALGLSGEAIAEGVRALRSVPGRLERVPGGKVRVLVDYAHKPDALKKVLRALQEIRGGAQILTVFGCGGDRDRAKRPVMGRIAAELSDYCFVTSDNPRTEDPEAIVAEITAGMTGFRNFTVEIDRERAIRAAILSARPGDLVLIAGKGHEDYQIIADPVAPGGTRKIHFDDREVAARALGELPSTD